MRGDIPRCDACRALSVDAHVLKAEGGPTTDPRSCRRQNQTVRMVAVPGPIFPLPSQLSSYCKKLKALRARRLTNSNGRRKTPTHPLIGHTQ
jgi:hypothetical protein